MEPQEIDENEYTAPLIGAIDQGTSSSRFLIFSARSGTLVTMHQIELPQSFPQDGWVEMDPSLILDTTRKCIDGALKKLNELGFNPQLIKAVGITNQRETTVVWDKLSGQPLYPAIVWQDQRTKDIAEELIAKAPGKRKEGLQHICGLPIHPYFSALKLHWLIKNVPEIQFSIDNDRCMAGTIDSWLIFHLTGYRTHATDVTNASRTALMNIRTLDWDDRLLKFFGIPRKILPKIYSSSEIVDRFNDKGPLDGVPISAILGDQQAALVGNNCLAMGTAKNTYGTGCFLLYNTGTKPVFSGHGLLTTVAFKFGPSAPTYYAIEGSVAVAGAAVRWLRDNLSILPNSAAVEDLAKSVRSTGGTYFVPAFTGLYAPYWDSNARGIICGMSQYTTKAHIARAALEAICFQTREILEAMNQDSGVSLESLKVDGGATKNHLLMQLQADLLGMPILRPQLPESTALGAAIAAGLAKGVEVWTLDQLRSIQSPVDRFSPKLELDERERKFRKWKQAVRCSLGWLSAEGPRLDEGRGIPWIPLVSGWTIAFAVGVATSYFYLKYAKG